MNDLTHRMTVAVIVAHPDDEVLWAGGTILSHRSWKCVIVCLCRKHDPDRAPRFQESLLRLHATGSMGDLDDGPEQAPQRPEEIERLLLDLLPDQKYDLVMTHHPSGEYTRHRRHEEIALAVLSLWTSGRLHAEELFLFAYHDGHSTYLPRAVAAADLHFELSHRIWREKYMLITQTYGFTKDSWEARTTPRTEAFFRLTDKKQAARWLTQNH